MVEVSPKIKVSIHEVRQLMVYLKNTTEHLVKLSHQMQPGCFFVWYDTFDALGEATIIAREMADRIPKQTTFDGF